MDAEKKAEFRATLEGMLSELEQVRELSADAQAVVELDQQAVGRLSRMDALQQQAMAKATEANRNRDISGIKAALERLEEGEFGECVECGEPIAPKRLELNPVVLTCISCASGG